MSGNPMSGNPMNNSISIKINIVVECRNELECVVKHKLESLGTEFTFYTQNIQQLTDNNYIQKTLRRFGYADALSDDKLVINVINNNPQQHTLKSFTAFKTTEINSKSEQNSDLPLLTPSSIRNGADKLTDKLTDKYTPPHLRNGSRMSPVLNQESQTSPNKNGVVITDTSNQQITTNTNRLPSPIVDISGEALRLIDYIKTHEGNIPVGVLNDYTDIKNVKKSRNYVKNVLGLSKNSNDEEVDRVIKIARNKINRDNK